MLLRWYASVRGRRLPQLLTAEGADWAALGRVSGGGFLDTGSSRGRGGPRGTLLVKSGTLEWRPDGYEAKHGYAAHTWPLADVKVLSRRRRRDISGLRVDELTFEVPEGVATLGLFHPVGVEPASFRPPAG